MWFRYVLDSTKCMCNLTDICEAQSPCVNGICILLSQPDDYFCNCTGTSFIGQNCGKLKNVCVLNDYKCVYLSICLSIYHLSIYLFIYLLFYLFFKLLLFFSKLVIYHVVPVMY